MCEDKYIELISRYLDDDLDADESTQLKQHLETCAECMKAYEDMKKIKQELHQTQKSSLEAEWYSQTSKKINKERFKKINYKRVLSYAAAFIAVMIIGGTIYNHLWVDKYPTESMDSDRGISTPTSPENSYGDGLKDASQSTDTGSGTSDESSSDSSLFDPDKIIYTANISLYTSNYKDTTQKISDYAKSIGGFVENSSIAINEDTRYDYTNYGYLQIRVPSGKFTEAINMIGTYGEVQSENTNSSNVTQSYRNIESELESLRIQETKLLEYLSKAQQMSDMLTIESELSRVRTEINYRVSMLQNYDTAIDYSTITISMYEQDLPTSSITSPFGSFFNDIKKAIVTSINLILQIISTAIIWIFRLLPFAAIAAVIYFIIIKLKRNGKKA